MSRAQASSSPGCAGRQVKTRSAARRVARPGDVVGAGDRDLVHRRLQPGMPVVVEVRLVRLPRRLGKQRRALRERDADQVRAGGHRRAQLQVRVEIVVRRLVVQRLVLAVRRRLHREEREPLAVEQQLHVLGAAQPLDVLVAVAREADGHLVHAVDREGVRHQRAAPRADRQPFEVLLLGQVGTHADRRAAGREPRAADRELADLLRRRDVALEQGRREIAYRDVVEAVARRVARQQVGNVHIEGEQVADGVVVLRPVEPPEGVGAARVRVRGRDVVERRLERRERRAVGGLVRPPAAHRRHLARPELAGHLLPRLRVGLERLPR